MPGDALVRVLYAPFVPFVRPGSVLKQPRRSTVSNRSAQHILGVERRLRNGQAVSLWRISLEANYNG